MQTYVARLKTREQMDAEIPRERHGWWADVCPGATLLLRDATQADVDRCMLKDKWSRNPSEFLCELSNHGALVCREAVEELTPNA